MQKTSIWTNPSKPVKKINIKFLFSQAMRKQIDYRIDNLKLDSYLDLFVKSVKDATWHQDRTCYYICLTEDKSTFLDLRTQCMIDIARLFKQNFKNTIMTDGWTMTIYK